jgi:hypothetical protein
MIRQYYPFFWYQMKKKWSVIFILFCLLVQAEAPAQELVKGADTSAMLLNKPDNRYAYVINLDNRYSFVNGNVINMFGLKAGIELNHKWRFGLGYYNYIFPIKVSYSYQNTNYPAKLTFWYLSVYAERVLVHKKKYEISLPFALGAGTSNVMRTLPNMAGPTYGRRTTTLAEISVNGYYKLANWIGPGIGIGYRSRINSTQALRKAFDVPIYILRVQIFLDVLYVDLFPQGIRHRSDPRLKRD